jgi:hypothetical protein
MNTSKILSKKIQAGKYSYNKNYKKQKKRQDEEFKSHGFSLFLQGMRYSEYINE